MAKRIAGIALFPRESRNLIYYHEEELKKFDNQTVPLRWNHMPDPEFVIGEAKFFYDPEKMQVRYEAEITDEKYQNIVDQGKFQVSIGATQSQESQMCDDTGRRCLNAPVIGSIDELSIVETPGIPESTLSILEREKVSFYPKTSCGTINVDCNPAPVFITSDKYIKEKKTIMTKEDTPKKVEEKVKVTIETDDDIEVANDKKEEPEEKKEQDDKECPDGKKLDPITKKCVDKEPKKDSEKVVEKAKETADSEIKKMIKDIREAWIPKSEVKESTEDIKTFDEDYTDEEAKKILEKLDENGYVKIKIDKEDWIAKHTRGLTKDGKLTEVVSTSGTIPTIVADSQVVIDKQGKTVTSLRAWGRFKAIPTGANTARFYRLTVPDAGAITESPTTDITSSTHTLTSVDVTCAIRGWRQTVERAEFEDFPAAFLNAVRESARIEAIRDEHRLIVQDLAATDHDFGGTTTHPFHISADDGAAVTDTTTEDAAAQLAPAGLTLAKMHLQTNHKPELGPNSLVAFIAPLAFENLYTNTNLSEYTMIGSPTITRTGILEKIYGIDIVITNELLVQNNAFRNLLVVKGEAWALASQRSMSIQLQDQIAGQYTDIVWTHRIGVDIINPRAYVIISGPNT